MKPEQFDQKVERLYRQRQEELNVPPIDLNKLSHKKARASWLKSPLVILLGGGSASFAIMALIQYLAVPKNELPAQTKTEHYVEVEVIEKAPNASIVVTPPLPPKPEVPNQLPEKPKPSSAESQGKVTINGLRLLNPKEINSEIVLESLKSPNVAIEPVYKVLPNFDTNAFSKRDLGIVKLAYRVNEQGEVFDIVIKESTASRLLNRAAKKALAQWQYRQGVLNGTEMEVIFSFEN